MEWIDIEKQLPDDGNEVLLQNDHWINDDGNPKGIRFGFLSDGVWYSAYYCSLHDEYHLRDSDEDNTRFKDCFAINQVPTHWMSIPSNN